MVISVNPIAGLRSSAARVDRLAELLRARRLHVEVLGNLGEVASRANQWQAAGRLRALVGVGGDGTAAELANRTVPGVPLIMLPSGNENLLARHLGHGHTAEACCEAIQGGAVAQFDAGKANDRIFLIMLSCGFDADVVHRVHVRRMGHCRSLHYVKPILSAIRSYQYPEMRIDWCEGGAEAGGGPGSARWLFAFNAPCYGGGLRICPQADGSDGLLDVCTFQHGNLWHFLRYATAVLLRQHRRLADFNWQRVRRVRITSVAEVRYQLDGDPGGVLPVDVEVLPGRLTVLVPKRK